MCGLLVRRRRRLRSLALRRTRRRSTRGRGSPRLDRARRRRASGLLGRSRRRRSAPSAPTRVLDFGARLLEVERIPRRPNCFKSSFEASSSSSGSARKHLDDRHLGAETLEDRRELGADDPAADEAPRPRSARAGLPSRRSAASRASSSGGRSGNEPVAMIAFLNATSSLPSTAIVFASLKRPVPFTHSTPFAWNRLATPPVICLTTPAFHSFAVAKSSVGAPTWTPSFGERLLCFLDRERGLHPRLGRNAADAQARRRARAPSMQTVFAPSCPGESRRCSRLAASEDGDVTPFLSIPTRRFRDRSYRRSGLRSAAVRPAKDLGRRAVESLRRSAAANVDAISSISPTQRHPLFAADRAARRTPPRAPAATVRHSSSVDSTSSARARSRIASNKAALPFVHAAYAILTAEAADVLRDDDRVDRATANRSATSRAELPTGRCAWCRANAGGGPTMPPSTKRPPPRFDGRCDRSRACGEIAFASR